MKGYLRLLIVVSVALIVIGVVTWRRTHRRPQPAQPQANASAIHLRIGYIPIVECAHLYVGINRKYFQEEGIHIELQPMKGGAVIIPALQTGDLDVGFANVVSLIATNSTLERDAPRALKALVGASYERPENLNHGLLVKTASAITIQDLVRNDIKIAVNTTRNIEDLMLRRFLRAKGVDDSRLNLLTMGFPDMLPALDRGDIDVASVVEPFIQPALRTGKYRLLANQYIEVSKETAVATYACTNKWLQEHPDAAARFSRAFMHANEFIKTNDVEAREIIGSFTRIRKEDLSIIGIPAFEFSVKPDSLRELSHEMLQFGFIKSEPDVAAMLHTP